MQRTNIYLEDRQTAALDRRAAEEGVSRAEVIRRLIDRALRGPEDDVAADLARMRYAFERVVEIDLPDRRPSGREHLADSLADPLP